VRRNVHHGRLGPPRAARRGAANGRAAPELAATVPGAVPCRRRRGRRVRRGSGVDRSLVVAARVVRPRGPRRARRHRRTVHPAVIEALAIPDRNRPNAAEAMIRLEHMRERFVPLPEVGGQPRPAESVTMQSASAERYDGEVAITLRDLPDDDRVAVLGTLAGAVPSTTARSLTTVLRSLSSTVHCPSAQGRDLGSDPRDVALRCGSHASTTQSAVRPPGPCARARPPTRDPQPPTTLLHRPRRKSNMTRDVPAASALVRSRLRCLLLIGSRRPPSSGTRPTDVP